MQTSNLRTHDSSLPLAILGAAVVLGLLGDQLLRAGPLGLNVFLWVAALAGAVLGLARYARVPLHGDGRWLLVPRPRPLRG
jgi:hypothetical protein